MSKHALAGFLLVVVIGFAFFIPYMFSSMEAEMEKFDDLTIFEDIDELDFLAPYEVEKTEPELPNHALKGYCAKISYEGKEYSVTALAFESEEWAKLYGWGVPEEESFANYYIGLDDTKNRGFVKACGGGNYYEIEGNSDEDFIEFVNFMSSNMKLPVYQGD